MSDKEQYEIEYNQWLAENYQNVLTSDEIDEMAKYYEKNGCIGYDDINLHY